MLSCGLKPHWIWWRTGCLQWWIELAFVGSGLNWWEIFKDWNSATDSEQRRTKTSDQKCRCADYCLNRRRFLKHSPHSSRDARSNIKKNLIPICIIKFLFFRYEASAKSIKASPTAQYSLVGLGPENLQHSNVIQVSGLSKLRAFRCDPDWKRRPLWAQREFNPFEFFSS